MKLDSYGLYPWRAAILISAAERDREPLTTRERIELLLEHFPEMSMAEIVELEAGAIKVLRAIGTLMRRFGLELEASA